MPGSYSVMDMGYVDAGGGPVSAHPGGLHGDHEGAISVSDLVEDTDRPADVVVDLEARQGTVTLESGRKVEGYTLNGASPGPTIEATVGDLLEVRVHNEDVEDGVSVHWHGVDVPNAEDGVAGVTQDAIGVGEDHVYRFVVDDAGARVPLPPDVPRAGDPGALRGAGREARRDRLPHRRPGRHPHLQRNPDPQRQGGRRRGRRVPRPGGPHPGGEHRQRRGGSVDRRAVKVLAVDGRDINQPSEVVGRRVAVPAGGRYDLEVVAPARIESAGSTAIVLGSGPRSHQPAGTSTSTCCRTASRRRCPSTRPSPTASSTTPWAVGPASSTASPVCGGRSTGTSGPTCRCTSSTRATSCCSGSRTTAARCTPCTSTATTRSSISRDGEPATGSPWWVDSVDVENDETVEIAFVADNPGVWMDHCHNLKHAAQGLVAHLMYSGVTSPYRLGDDSGNEPE